jgi:hypothetical protein
MKTFMGSPAAAAAATATAVARISATAMVQKFREQL